MILGKDDIFKKNIGLMLVVVLVFLLGAGCATVKIKKVPNQASYIWDIDKAKNKVEFVLKDKKGKTITWNEFQKKADAQKGVRYYLPRPYVLVKQEFPVRGATFFVSGKINKKSDVISIDIGDVPLEYRKYFPKKEVPLFDTKDSMGKGKKTPKSEIQSGKSDSGKKDKEEKDKKEKGDGEEQKQTFELLEDANIKVTIKTTLKDKLVPSEKEVVVFSVELKRDVVTGRKAELIEDKLYLVPQVKNKHTLDKKVEFSAKLVKSGDKVPFVMEGQIEGSKIPRFASVAMAIKQKEPEKTLLVHHKEADIINPFAAEDGKSDKGAKEETTEDGSEEETKSKTTITTSGNPATPPVIKVGDLYDIIYLPDFTEQYAIKTRAGLGTAKMDIGLEYGWMAESVKTETDNSGVGKFLYENITKFIDLGVTALKPVEKAAEAIAETDAVTEEKKDEIEAAADKDGTTRVILKVVVLEIATPGLHPLIKRKELWMGQFNGNQDAIGDGDQKQPLAPKVKYTTCTSMQIALVSLGEKKDAPGEGDSCKTRLTAAISKIKFGDMEYNGKKYLEGRKVNVRVQLFNGKLQVFLDTELKSDLSIKKTNNGAFHLNDPDFLSKAKEYIEKQLGEDFKDCSINGVQFGTLSGQSG